MVCVVSTNSTGIREKINVRQVGRNTKFIASAKQGLSGPFPVL